MGSLPLKGNSVLPVTLREGLSSSHLPGLDGLRMVAVFLVVFYHLGFPTASGGHGVLIFFVLSGFLITWLLLKEQEQFGSISLRLFYLRRVLRIFPAFYCFWLLWTAAQLLFDKPIVWGQALSALAYLTNYYQAIFGDPDTGYSHTLSLGIEEQFYLLWPVCLLALGRDGQRIPAVLVAVIGTVWVYRGVLQFVVGIDQGYIYEAFDTRADHLAIGCLLAVLLRSGRLPWLWGWLCIPWMSILTLSLLVTSMWLAQVFGTLSYSIYLYQQVVIPPIQKTLASYPLPVRLGVALTTVILVAGVSYHLVEQPFLRLKNTIASHSAGWRRRLVLGEDSLDYVHRPV